MLWNVLYVLEREAAWTEGEVVVLLIVGEVREEWLHRRTLASVTDLR